MTLLEAERRKCDVLERWAVELPNLRVVWGRAEEQPLEQYGVAVAKALAHPPTAAEWCLPLVREGGAVLLWVGPSAEPDRVAAVADRIAGRLEPAPAGFLLLRKVGRHAAGLPPPPGHGAEAAARLSARRAPLPRAVACVRTSGVRHRSPSRATACRFRQRSLHSFTARNDGELGSLPPLGRLA